MAPDLEVEEDVVDMAHVVGKPGVPGLEGKLEAPGCSQHMAPDLEEVADSVVLAGLDKDDVLVAADNALLASWTLGDLEEKIG